MMSEQFNETLETKEEVTCSISNGQIPGSCGGGQASNSEARNNVISKSKCLTRQVGKSALNNKERLSSSSDENLQMSFTYDYSSHGTGANDEANSSHSTGATSRSLAEEQRSKMISDEDDSNVEKILSNKKQIRKRRKDRVRGKSNEQRNTLFDQVQYNENLSVNQTTENPLKSDANEPRTFCISNENRTEQNAQSEIRHQNQATADRSLSTEQLSLYYSKEQSNKSLSSGYASMNISNEHLSTSSLSERLNRSTSAGQLSRSNASLSLENYDFNISLGNVSFATEYNHPILPAEIDSMETRY